MSEQLPLSLLNRRWALQAANERTVLALKQRFQIPEILARILVLRGVDLDSAEHFLTPRLRHLLPNPCILKDMKKAILRAAEAIKQNQKIAVFGDYDVDGATSSALLKRFFATLGIEITLYIPDRMKDGYGPSPQAFSKLASEGNKLVITVDCGTMAYEAMEAAKGFGLDVIIIDHHTPSTKLPMASAFVNPHRLDETGEVASKLRHLASVGLCFLFVVGLHSQLKEENWYGDRPQPELFDLLDLVALGTVCDVMPLTGLNRAFVSQGLKVLEQRQNIGLAALADIAKLEATPQAYHLGFVLGPRINAAGRIGKSHLGAMLLSVRDRDKAKSIAAELDALNEERRNLEKGALIQAIEQAESQDQSCVIYVYNQEWHEGIIGIVAGRLKDKFNKPSFAMTMSGSIIKGSARSIVGLDMGALIQKAVQKGLLKGGGGHPMAAGFTLSSEQLSLFHSFLEQEIQILVQKLDLTPILTLDSIIDLKGVNTELAQTLEKLAPTGLGNPSPKFLIHGVTIDSAQIINDQHVRCTLKQMNGDRLSAIAFRAVDTPLGIALIKSDKYALDIVVTLKHDTWNGNAKVQVHIEDAMYAKESLKAIAV